MNEQPATALLGMKNPLKEADSLQKMETHEMLEVAAEIKSLGYDVSVSL